MRLIHDSSVGEAFGFYTEPAQDIRIVSSLEQY